jgi:hypothetical protein
MLVTEFNPLSAMVVSRGRIYFILTTGAAKHKQISDGLEISTTRTPNFPA